MGNLIKILFLLIGIFIVFKVLPPPDENYEPYTQQDFSNVAVVQNYDATTKEIPSETVNYLKTSQKWGNYYNANKKFAVYFTGANCPYGRAFSDAISKIANDETYKQYYNFYPINVSGGFQVERYNSTEEAKQDGAFNSLCQEFCIVNPATNKIFYLDGVGEQEAAIIQRIMDDHKNW